VIQAIFICLFYFAAFPIYNGWLMLGYSTFYTSLPVFSLVLDVDADRSTVNHYPILYRTLSAGRMLNFTAFCVWLMKSIYQGSTIILLGMILFQDSTFTHIVSITFTALVFTEWLNILTEINKWHKLMVLAELGSVCLYLLSFFLLGEYFDIDYIFTVGFMWRVSMVTGFSWGPVHLITFGISKYWPSETEKVKRESIHDY
jgi:phospholipid-translocating ATPase